MSQRPAMDNDASLAIDVHDVFSLYATPRGHVAALRGLSLTVPVGQRILVHGPNGSGKTTLLRVLSGERAPSAGTVRVAGIDLVGADDGRRTELRSRRLGIVDQHHARTLRPELSVLDNVALQLRLAGTPASAAHERAYAALTTLGLAILGSRSPGTLSGGEAARVAICAAIAHAPDIVLADEPTGELDRESADSVYDLLAEATSEVGACLVLVSHDSRAMRIVDRVVRIRDGRLSEEWTPATVDDESLVVDDRGWVRLPEPLRHQTGIAARVRAVGVAASIVLSPVDGQPSPTATPTTAPTPATPAPTPPEVVARLRDVTVTRGGRSVLEGLDLDVTSAALTVVAGPSGSGKTTLLRLLAGLERPDAGTITVGDVDLATLDRSGLARLRRQQIAVAAQNGSLIETFDIDDNLAWLRDARGLPNDPAVIDQWIDALGLAPIRHRAVRVLSGGERQRVAVARVLAAEPTLAILDEPTSQQDEANAERLVAVLGQAVAAGIAVVVATHDPLLVATADHLLSW